MLADRGSRPGGHEAGHGRDVERRFPAEPGTPGAHDVGGAGGQVERFGGSQHGPHQAGGLVGGLPFDLEGDEEAGDLGRIGLAIQDFGEDGLGLVGAEMVAVAEPPQQVAPAAEVVEAHGLVRRSGGDFAGCGAVPARWPHPRRRCVPAS